MPKPLWTNERIDRALDRCRTNDDDVALLYRLRDEYQAELDAVGGIDGVWMRVARGVRSIVTSLRSTQQFTDVRQARLGRSRTDSRGT